MTSEAWWNVSDPRTLLATATSEQAVTPASGRKLYLVARANFFSVVCRGRSEKWLQSYVVSMAKFDAWVDAGHKKDERSETVWHIYGEPLAAASHAAEPWARHIVCQNIREVVCNPYQSVIIPKECLTPAVQAIAAAAYGGHKLDGTLDNECLLVLSDALEDAGLTENRKLPGVLEHLRSPGPHLRGCWALDLVLGRS